MLNGFKRRKVLRGYAIIGAIASTAYMEPIFTEDLDIIVLVGTESEYLRVFQDVSKSANGHSYNHLASKLACNSSPLLKHSLLSDPSF